MVPDTNYMNRIFVSFFFSFFFFFFFFFFFISNYDNMCLFLGLTYRQIGGAHQFSSHNPVME